uniref:Uncharacterized protein n=1 Tax=Lactuca sativa TaxID=4236 RepID=A0A9R1V037_LACSA|nr:hypothetical protein LSAT_V11C700364070 [Lactuca sativa]
MRSISLSIAWITSSAPLFWCLVGWFLVGTAYSANVVRFSLSYICYCIEISINNKSNCSLYGLHSQLPLLRWKRFPLTAALYMLMARVLMLPVGCYMHMKVTLFYFYQFLYLLAER